jgi:diaminopimelate epimerase
MIPFLKMHGLGNDFVVLDGRREPLRLARDLVRRMGDRHRGIGFDQLALLEPSVIADVAVRFFNRDGSEAGACGNASRCIAALVADETGRDRVHLETKAGVLAAERHADGRVTVAMPAPQFAWNVVPLREPIDTMAVDLQIADLPPAVCLSMGNPHAVFFVDDVDRITELGPVLELHAMFPQGANIGFARRESADCFRLRVFERGAGLTLACGSGACAAMAAAVRRGLASDRATLILDGGELHLAWSGQGAMAMTGSWSLSFSGTFDPDTIGCTETARP